MLLFDSLSVFPKPAFPSPIAPLTPLLLAAKTTFDLYTYARPEWELEVGRELVVFDAQFNLGNKES